MKYRVWDNELNKFVTAGIVLTPEGVVYQNKTLLRDYVLQYSTGLLDRRKIEIFEGDLIVHHNDNKNTKEEYWLPIYQVCRDKWNFFLNHIGGGKNADSTFSVRYYSHKEIEIVGNTFNQKGLSVAEKENIELKKKIKILESKLKKSS